MNGLEPTLSPPSNLELYQRNITPVGPVDLILPFGQSEQRRLR